MIPHRHNFAPKVSVLLALTAVLLLIILPAAAAPQTRYVDGAGGGDAGDCASPANPCKTISYALTQANGGDTIKVAKGTYKENLLVKDNIDLFGGFNAGDWAAAPATFGSIIDGGRLGSVVRYKDGFAGTLNGFKITRGKADLGGGVYSEKGSPTLQNLWIVDNEATDSGGGVYFTQGQGAISNSKLEGNQAANFGGAIHITSSSSDLSELFIHDNKAGSGGALSLNSTGKVILKGADLRLNNGASQSGAIHLVDALLHIEDSIITRNKAADHGGAMTAEGSQVKITNGLIYGNSTTAGPASVMAFSTSEVFITNSTIAANAPGGHQAFILWGSSGTLVVKNSIMWNNSLNFQADPPCPSCFIPSYSDIQGYSGGTGNIDKDPLFRSPGTADYRLKANSPCIDAGTKVGAPTNDLDGTLRDSKPDMGAYEYLTVNFQYQANLPLIISN